MTTPDIKTTTQNLGIFLQPGIGNAYPELKKIEMALLRDKVSKLPWVPQGWIESVSDLDAQNPDAIVRVSYKKTLNVYGAPKFLQNDERQNIWDEIAVASGTAQGEYAKGQAAAGKAELDKLYARAAFWNAAYNVAAVVGAVPAKLAEGAGKVASETAMSAVKAFFPVLIIGGMVLAGAIWLGARGGLKGVAKAAVG